ncbi:MAG: D-xylose transport system permease protein [Frankiales bacterium]|jgi:D-xylose transport system permease protein|nr:D-xylose transport system permease protein [Frankiales bacterium]
MTHSSTQAAGGPPTISAPDSAGERPSRRNRRQEAASWGRSRRGRLGPLPVVVGLVIIWTIFQFKNDRFLSAQNLTDLALQIASTGTIAVGLFMVLVVGEIDLSVGIVSGLAGAILGVLAVNNGVNATLAIVAVVLITLLIGVLHGLIVVRVRVPSFVVTLAGLIGWQGLELYVLGNGGSINFPPSVITDLTSTFLGTPAAVALGAVLCIGYAATLQVASSRRARAGLRRSSTVSNALRVLLLAALLALAIFELERDRGVPLALLIFIFIVVLVDIIMRKTQFGRHVLAVGGNREAARRAGIPVDRIRVEVLAFSAMMAGVGGVLSASRLLSVSASAGTGDTLLNAIAAVVIGGTSLFGGRGSAYSALLGMLLIGSISNGMDLLSLDSSVKLMITGIVLLLAVSVDALSRARR